MPAVRLLGLDFPRLSLIQAAEHIAARRAGAPFAYIVTPNADHLVRLGRDPALRRIYRGSFLCLLDSRVVAKLARLIGLTAPPVVTGSDLTAYLLAHHILPGERITIIGLSPVWLPALMTRYDLAPPMHVNPPIGFDRDSAGVAAVIAAVRAHPSRFVFLALGSPRQERLAAALQRAGGLTGTGLCIGASLEFLCGTRRRAPVWLQNLALEWLWRLAGEPRRLARRYLVESPRVIGALLMQRLTQL